MRGNCLLCKWAHTPRASSLADGRRWFWPRKRETRNAFDCCWMPGPIRMPRIRYVVGWPWQIISLMWMVSLRLGHYFFSVRRACGRLVGIHMFAYPLERISQILLGLRLPSRLAAMLCCWWLSKSLPGRVFFSFSVLSRFSLFMVWRSVTLYFVSILFEWFICFDVWRLAYCCLTRYLAFVCVHWPFGWAWYRDKMIGRRHFWHSYARRMDGRRWFMPLYILTRTVRGCCLMPAPTRMPKTKCVTSFRHVCGWKCLICNWFRKGIW